MTDRKKIKILLIIIPVGFLLVHIIMFFGLKVLNEKQHEEIHRVIELHGGEVLEIEQVSREESAFEKGNSYNIFYEIRYSKDGEIKTAWYRGGRDVGDINKTSRGHPIEWILDE